MKRTSIAIVAALAASFMSFASADTGTTGGQGANHGDKHFKHGHGFHHGGGLFGFEHVMTKLEPQLNLSSQQQAQFQAAQTASANLKAVAKQAHQNLKGQIDSEFAKPVLSFDAISQDEQEARQSVQAAAASAKAAWLAAYDGLTTAQQTQVSNVIQAALKKRQEKQAEWKAKHSGTPS